MPADADLLKKYNVASYSKPIQNSIFSKRITPIEEKLPLLETDAYDPPAFNVFKQDLSTTVQKNEGNINYLDSNQKHPMEILQYPSFCKNPEELITANMKQGSPDYKDLIIETEEEEICHKSIINGKFGSDDVLSDEQIRLNCNLEENSVNLRKSLSEKINEEYNFSRYHSRNPSMANNHNAFGMQDTIDDRRGTKGLSDTNYNMMYNSENITDRAMLERQQIFQAKKGVIDLLDVANEMLIGLEKQEHLPEECCNKAEKVKKTTQNVPKKKWDQNSLIFVFHKDWNLVINMMIGIHKSIRAQYKVKNPILDTRDFKNKDVFELHYKKSIEDYGKYRGKCYFFNVAPTIFQEIRSLYDIENEDYLKSIGSETLITSLMKGEVSSLISLTTSGKSGSFFYYSFDGKYILKTVKREEYKFLKVILQGYYEHLKNNKDTLIPKFFGLHKIFYTKKKALRGYLSTKKVYFVIMNNLFDTELEIHKRYDLKGSTYKRFVKSSDPS